MATTWQIKEYDRFFAGDPWYGDNIMDSLQRIPTEHWHQPVGHQTIAKVVGHMLAWRKKLVEHLQDGVDFELAFRSAEEWPEVSHLSPKDLLDDLQENQTALLKTLAGFPSEKLPQTVPFRHKYTTEEIISGVLHHDFYHLGQINLLTKLVRT